MAQTRAEKTAKQRAYRNRPGRRERDRALSAQYHAAYAAADREGWRAKRTANTRRWKQEHVGEVALLRRRERLKSPEACILYRLRCRCKRDGHAFNLELADIVIPEFCPVLGMKLDPVGFAGRSGGALPNSPSVDRMFPHLGYVKGNITIISYRANRLKCDGTLAEVQAVADWMRQRQAELRTGGA